MWVSLRSGRDQLFFHTKVFSSTLSLSQLVANKILEWYLQRREDGFGKRIGSDVKNGGVY
jgi:hypothetical protein